MDVGFLKFLIGRLLKIRFLLEGFSFLLHGRRVNITNPERLNYTPLFSSLSNGNGAPSEGATGGLGLLGDCLIGRAAHTLYSSRINNPSSR